MIKCELCPIQDHCPAYEEAEKDNANSYYPQQVVRVSDWAKPPCPLIKLIRKVKK